MRFLPLLFTLLLNVSLVAQNSSKDILDHVDGIIINKQNGEIIKNAIITLKSQGKIVDETKSDENGKFSFDLNADSRYQVSGIYQNFTKNIKLIFTSKGGRVHQIKLELYPIEEFTKKNGKEMIIAESIEFLPDDYSLSNKAIKTLENVYAILEKYKHLKIEIGFHTDSRGDQKFLLKLTQKRAEVCANYLIDKGVDPSRVFPKGYGATQLINHCKPNVKCTNTEHLENRRTEFVVINNSDS